MDNVNYQHFPEVLAYLRRLGVKIVHNARYNPRGAMIEAAFGEVKKYLQYHIPRWMWSSRPKCALRIAMRSVSAKNARAYCRAAQPAAMRQLEAMEQAKRTRLLALLMLAVALQ